jgi:hypothetical protein
MKIETIDMVQPEPEPEPVAAPRMERGLIARAAIAGVMAVLLVVTLQWALNVTNANARQLSSSLSSLQGRLDRRDSEARAVSSADGPILEPADERR